MAEIRRSAAYRIAFTYTAAVALAVILLGSVVYGVTDAQFQRQQDVSLQEETAGLLHDYREEGFAELKERIGSREAAAATNAFGYVIYDRAGRRIAGALRTPPVAPGWHDIRFIDPVEGSDPARALAAGVGDGNVLIVAADAEPLERIHGAILLVFASGLAVLIVVGLIGALTLGSYLRRRIARIGDTAEAIVAGDLDRRVVVGPRGDEFDRLGASLNAMLDRIAMLLDSLRQVSSDVAHDLRTPLSRLRNGLELGLRRRDDPEAAARALETGLEQSDALLSVFAAILRISEVEAGAIARTFAPLDLGALVRDLCETCEPAIGDGGRILRCVAPAGIVVDADRQLLAQAVVNLLDNAQAYTPEGTVVTVSVSAGARDAALVVADDGPGVDAADRDRIVRRFVRLERSRTTPGNGLGLNLVSAIAHLHAGRLVLDDNAPGLRAAIMLPRSGPAGDSRTRDATGVDRLTPRA